MIKLANSETTHKKKLAKPSGLNVLSVFYFGQ